MKIHDVMTCDAHLTSPELRTAAQRMKASDCGSLPVAEGGGLVGMITDRDIAIRCVAEGKDPNTKVRESMTHEVKSCVEDDELEAVCRNMSDIQMRRLPVMNRDKRLVGIVSLGGLTQGQPESAMALHRITQAGSQHNQSRSA